jgi:Protein of unknown function (DUF2838)
MIRFYRYKNRSWHYYLFDYCYFVNLLNTFVILFEPKNKYLFFMLFTNACGPIMNYFFCFRSKISFEDIDGMTNFFMHYSPGLLCLVLRFYNQDSEYFITATEWDSLVQGSDNKTWLLYITSGFLYY